MHHAAQRIGVSSATIRNWAKAGHLAPASTRPLSFHAQTIQHLQQAIDSGAFARLQRRANKRGSGSDVLPAEYAGHPQWLAQAAEIVAWRKEKRLALDRVMWLAAIRLLESTGEVRVAPQLGLFSLQAYSAWARASVRAVMLDWLAALTPDHDATRYMQLFEHIMPAAGEDFLGLLYQSLATEGHKSARGAYYTPATLVEDALSHMEGPIDTFLDPCCGTGAYLLAAARTFTLSPEHVVGIDCDPLAANIARLNLLLAYAGQEFAPRVLCLDALNATYGDGAPLPHNIDLIATNPPWGACKKATGAHQAAGHVKSGETFALFLEKSLHLLRDGGQLSFLLPESILKIKTHADIRELLLRTTSIKTIACYGRQFTGVFTPVIRLDLIKALPDAHWQVAIEQHGAVEHVRQARFQRNAYSMFDVFTTEHDAAVLQKLYAVAHNTLAQHADWALGIVTGNNRQYVLPSPAPGAEAIVRGGDVHPYALHEPTAWLTFTPAAFQQTAPERLFRAPEKLIYKFISNTLVFAYDDRQRLALNSANIVIPRLPGMTMKVALAFLNSAVFRYIFQKKFATHKVLRGDLEKLPFPHLSQHTQATITRLVDLALATRHAPVELDELVFAAFQLEPKEIAAIKDDLMR